MTATRKAIAVICPVHNEESSIDYFFDRLFRTMESLASDYDFAIYFVNNDSTDGTLDKILALRARDPRVQVITHSRNFGYQASWLSGLTHARGDAIVAIDGDCEDPPEMIATFVKRWTEGYDIVYGLRQARPESPVILAARRFFYRLTHVIADWDFVIDMAEFSLFTDRVRRQILRHRSTYPFVRSELGYVGFRRIGIPYDREPRRFGATHYNFVRMTKFAVAGILTTSTFPLRVIAYVGLPLAVLNFILAGLRIAGAADGVGWLTAINWSFLAMTLAFLAIYTARVAKDVTGRPVFIVDLERSHLNHEISVD